MKLELTRKMRNRLIIYSVVCVVIFVIQLLNHLAGFQMNSSGPAIAIGVSLWLALEGEREFAKIKERADMNRSQAEKDRAEKWDE